PETAWVRSGGGSATARLRCAGVDYTLPADVPAGSCSILVEESPGAWQTWGRLDLAPGARVAVSCANRNCRRENLAPR
ncbi:MAG TPA: hypothetical protein PKA64_26620, partial [Myxococcota bacterium]|nr:hypothetical protein [Myxococcota bacterium]